MNLIDLKKLHALRDKPEFNNFFKSAGYKATTAFLVSRGVPEHQRLQRTLSGPNTPSTVMAHPLIALEFMRWLDYDLYLTRLSKQLGVELPPPA